MVSISASEISVSNSEQPNIAIIGAAAFLHVSKLLGSYNFELCLCSSDIQANSVKLAEASCYGTLNTNNFLFSFLLFFLILLFFFFILFS